MLLSLALFAGAASAVPQMGWNSWNKFACEITEELIKDTADALVSTGLAELGYKYVNLDDCWQAAERDASGMIQADPTRFPSGMTALGEYIHSKGLKFGIYSSAGFKTCQGFPASLGLEETDARAYAAWGVDYLKYDNCYEDHGLPKTRYGEMKKALESSGREIFYSLCEWGRENPAVWAPGIGANSWRISSDIRDEWSSIISRVEIDGSLWRYSGEGLGWNDPDMLEVGNGGCSQAEYRAHFSLWAMLKAPMIIGNDVRTLSTKVMEILGNKEVLAVSQDALGHQARRVWSDTTQHLAKSTHFGDKVIATKCSAGKGYEDAKEDQDWVLSDEGTIMSSSTGRCLSEVSFEDALTLAETAFGAEAVHSNRSELMHSVTTADCSTATLWDAGQYIGGSIVSRSSQLCLEVAKEDFLPVVQGKRVQTAPCHDLFGKQFLDVTEHQSWTAPGSALLNLYQRQCLTVDRDAFSGVAEEVWMTPMSGGSVAVLLLNKSPVERLMTLDGSVVGLSGGKYAMRDLWRGEDLIRSMSADQSEQFLVKSHDAVMLKLTPA